jgi:hypothetical protein
VAEKQKPGRKNTRGQKNAGGGSAGGGDGGGFDSWLETKLRTAYSSVLDEPIPDDLIQLIAQKLKD